MRFTPIIPPPSSAQATEVLSKNLQVICVGTRVDDSLECINRVPNVQKMDCKKSSVWAYGYSLIEDRNL